MPPTPLCFIVSEPSTLSKADQKRRRSKALSHAAIVAYTRRNLGSSEWFQVQGSGGKVKTAEWEDEPQRERKMNGGARGCDLIAISKKPSTGKLNSQGVRIESPAPRVTVHNESRLYEELDPFLKPASTLSSHERNVLHHCKFLV